MRKISHISLQVFFGLLLVAACSPADQATVPAATLTPRPVPTSTALPTPFPLGASVAWQGLQVTMLQAELTEDYVNEYGSRRIPSAGMKFLWVQVRLKNMGEKEIDMPGPEHFSALYVGAEFKPTYGHRRDYVDYLTLDDTLFQNQQADAWLRFDVPSTAGLSDLRFVFLPESSDVGVSSSSPTYPYAVDHPTYVWKCGSEK